MPQRSTPTRIRAAQLDPKGKLQPNARPPLISRISYFVPRSWRKAFLLALCALPLTACGPHNYLNQNDTLRARNLHLKNQLTHLKQKLTLTQDQNSALRQRLHPHPMTMPSAVIPELASLKIGSYSGLLPSHPHTPPTLRIYLRTLDGQGRFLPVAGQATVKAVTIPDQGKPELLAEKTFNPPTFDAAYRATFLGTHYSLNLPLLQKLPQSIDRITVKVIFTQAKTGVRLTAQQAFAAHPSATP